MGKRSCPATQTVEVIHWKTDTLKIVPPTHTIQVPTKEIIKVPTTPEGMLALIDTLKNRVVLAQSINDALTAQLAAVKNAKPGDKVETIFPYRTTFGNSMNKDSTVFLKWRVKYLGELAPDTPEAPNPYFEATVAHKENSTAVDSTKHNAIGLGALLKSDGNTVDVAPLVNIRVGKVTGYFGYYLVDKSVVIGATKEFQFGKKKNAK